tara:strand:+ start:2885 stop:3229 length:345 start_codon:yes stop_codon:yes gene_type:complete
MMKEWKKFLNEQSEDAEQVVEIGFESSCMLYYDKEIRKQKYILNSIREVAGVRIVTVTTPTVAKGAKQAVGVTIKFSPFRHKNTVSYIAFLKQSILTVKGVNTITFLRTTKVQL